MEWWKWIGIKMYLLAVSANSSSGHPTLWSIRSWISEIASFLVFIAWMAFHYSGQFGNIDIKADFITPFPLYRARIDRWRYCVVIVKVGSFSLASSGVKLLIMGAWPKSGVRQKPCNLVNSWLSLIGHCPFLLRLSAISLSSMVSVWWVSLS